MIWTREIFLDHFGTVGQNLIDRYPDRLRFPLSQEKLNEFYEDLRIASRHEKADVAILSRIRELGEVAKNDKEQYTVAEAAQFLSASPTSVRRAVAAGTLGYTELPGRGSGAKRNLRFSKRQLEEFLALKEKAPRI
jgi:excisionase family DNA binding protein